MYIYDRKFAGWQSRRKGQPINVRPAQRESHYPDRGVGDCLGRRGSNSTYVWAHEGLGQLSTDALSKKLKHLSLLPHFVEVNGKDAPLTPSQMDPKIYDGPDKYKIAPRLQECVKAVMLMERGKFRHIKVALVDVTKDVMEPEYAASFDHKEPVFAASVPKIAAMLAAFQLREDLLFLRKKGAKGLDELFELVRQDWADTQHDSGGKATPFTRGVFLRGKLVLVDGRKISLSEPRAPQLERVFDPVPAGRAITIRFKSTGEGKAALQSIVDDFNLKKEKAELKKARQELDAAKSESIRKTGKRKLGEAKQTLQEAKLKKRPQAKQRLEALGFWERLGIMVGGDVPASNFATSTIVRDVGFLYIASTLLQSGLYDTNRNGGLWLGADYWRSSWRGPLRRGSAQSATAGSLGAFMTLLVQKRLVSPRASGEMRFLMQKVPNLTFPGTGSWFWRGLTKLGSLKTVLAKVGLAGGGADDFAFIEREVDIGGNNKILLRYVAVGLRAQGGSKLERLILELDKCILANNGLTPAQGGHP